MNKKNKNQFGWGRKIFFLYTSFVIMIIFFVFRAMNQKIDLVAPDYYAQEIRYQDKLDRINRALELETPVKWEVGESNIRLEFPVKNGKKVTGEILFFRPSAKELDKTVLITPDENGLQLVPVKLLKPGLYHMQIDWKTEEETYFNEAVIVLKGK